MLSKKESNLNGLLFNYECKYLGKYLKDYTLK